MIGGADVFLDTNILIYASNGRIDQPEKWQVAQGLLTEAFATSGQVMSEFYVNATLKGPKPLSCDDADAWVRLLAQRPNLPVDASLVRAGIETSRRYQTSYWDGAIIAAAEKLGCKTLYSEDLSHGRTYGSVTVINPFL